MSTDAIVIPSGWGFAPGARLTAVRDHNGKGRMVNQIRTAAPAPRVTPAVMAQRIEYVLRNPQYLSRNGWRELAERFGMSRPATYHLLKRARAVRAERARAARLGVPVSNDGGRHVETHR